MKKPPIPMNKCVEMYNLYKVDGLRAQEIADKYHLSIQHLYRLFRELEGKPVWKKQNQSVRYKLPNRHFIPFPKPMREQEDKMKI